MLAALFVEKNGCYFGLPSIDPWDLERDARNYGGPHPVIAHPPCERWGKLAKVNYSRWGGEHNRPGNDGGCFAAALSSVLKYGGVLEHPKHSKAFGEFNLGKPSGRWEKTRLGWICEVWQSAYGHRANKATWLFYSGINAPFDLNWSRPKGTHQVGFQDRRGKARNKPTLSRKESRATPIKFRDTLIELANLARQLIEQGTNETSSNLDHAYSVVLNMVER